MLVAGLLSLSLVGCSNDNGSSTVGSVLSADPMIGTYQRKEGVKLETITFKKGNGEDYLMDKQHANKTESYDHPIIKLKESEIKEFYTDDPKYIKDGIFYVSPSEIAFSPTVYIRYPGSESIFVCKNGRLPREWVKK